MLLIDQDTDRLIPRCLAKLFGRNVRHQIAGRRDFNYFFRGSIPPWKGTLSIWLEVLALGVTRVRRPIVAPRPASCAPES